MLRDNQQQEGRSRLYSQRRLDSLPFNELKTAIRRYRSISNGENNLYKSRYVKHINSLITSSNNRASNVTVIGCVVLFAIAVILARHPQIVDRPISQIFSGILGKSNLFDEIMISFDTDFTFSGVIILSSLWGAWLRTDLASERGRILVGASSAVAASLVSRVLQHILSLHLRPYYDLSFNFHHYFSDKLNTWNSFPSDHVSAFAGLCAVVWITNAPFKYPVIIWTVFVESARMYVGAHYISDLLGGISLGVFMVALLQRDIVVYAGCQVARLATAQPARFYACAFFCSYQIATLGADIRNAAGGVKGVLTEERHEAMRCGSTVQSKANLNCAL